MSDPLESLGTTPAALERLHERFDRADAAQVPLACMLIAIDRIERCADGETRERMWNGLANHLRAQTELAGSHLERGQDLLWMLVPGRNVKESVALARKLVEGVRKLRVDGAPRISVSIGLAVSRPALCFEAFARVAEEGLDVARNGGDRAVHTEVYDFVQKKLTGKSLPLAKEFPAAPPRAPLREVELPAATPRTPARANPAEGSRAGAPVAAHSASSAASAHADELEEEGDRVQTLERRIAKLLRALESAEQRISRLESLDPAVGIASLYREVQGLDPDATNHEVKLQMMAAIFEANLALRGQASP